MIAIFLLCVPADRPVAAAGAGQEAWNADRPIPDPFPAGPAAAGLLGARHCGAPALLAALAGDAADAARHRQGSWRGACTRLRRRAVRAAADALLDTRGTVRPAPRKASTTVTSASSRLTCPRPASPRRVFKANSAILNALLTLLNEARVRQRQMAHRAGWQRHGSRRHEVPARRRMAFLDRFPWFACRWRASAS